MSDPAQRDSDRDTALIAELHGLTCNLRGALERFRFEARLNDLAEKEMPDARQRLGHVLKLTDDAAHRTLDLVEQSCPPAERTAREARSLGESWARFRARQISPEEFRSQVRRMDAFLKSARSDSEAVRANLAEVLLAQGFQDLTGQIIRSVMGLVAEVENALAELTRLARGESGASPEYPDENVSRRTGPAVPGVDPGGTVVNDQKAVDDLLSNLGRRA
jgi:chemotaxis protein CheZ